MRVPICLAAAALLAASLTGRAEAAAWDKPILVNDRVLPLTAPPVIQSGRILVPMRSYLEYLGATVSWEPPGRVTADVHGRPVAISIGSSLAELSGRQVEMDRPAQLIDGHTYVPLRDVSEGVGAVVYYDGTAVRITASTDRDRVIFDGPLNVRSAPSLAATVLTALPVGTRLGVLQYQGEWTQVLLPRGRVGWVASRYTSPAPTIPSLSAYSNVLRGDHAYLQRQGACLGSVPLVEGRLQVPLRQALEPMGGEVIVAGGAAAVRFGGRELGFMAGIPEAVVDQRTVPLDVAPAMVGEDLLVPARPLAQWLGLSLRWDSSRRTGYLESPSSHFIPGAVACNPASSAGAYILMDATTGLVLSEHRADQRRLIASTTKIMTGLLAVELANLDGLVTVSRLAASIDGSLLGLRTGQQMPLGDMLHGLMLRSGNDAAIAVAEHLAGSEAAFARIMNRRAVELGARSTDFHNASGLDDWSWPLSTARDLALISQAAMQDADFRSLVGAKSHWISGATGPQLLYNRNDFVHWYPGATGVKNGWTPSAGYTLVTSAHRSGREVLLVLLGVNTRDQVYSQAYQLMDQGFGLYDQSWILRDAG